MVCNEFIRCEVCGCITRIRLQVGWLDEHPIAVTCGKCGISLKGKVKIGQDTPGLKFEFENAERVNATLATIPDYVVECSGEFTTIKMCDWGLQEKFITPFIRHQQKCGEFDNYKSFGNSVAALKQTASIWPQYKHVLQLYKDGNQEYLKQEIKKLFPEEFIMCRNELEIMRAVRMIEVRGFLSPLKSVILELPDMDGGMQALTQQTLSKLERMTDADYGGQKFHFTYENEYIKQQTTVAAITLGSTASL